MRSLSFCQSTVAVIAAAVTASANGHAINSDALNPSISDTSNYDCRDPDVAYGKFSRIFRLEQPQDEAEYILRRDTFCSNLNKIDELNAQEASSGSGFRLGVTFHADLTQREYQELLKARSPALPTKPSSYDLDLLADQSRTFPARLDWRDKHVVGPVKNQWFCGSCYIFSGVGVIESAYSIANNCSAISLSEQQVLDCNGKTGCDGGWPVDVYLYAQANGLCRHNQYHYWSRQNHCKTDLVKHCEPKVFTKGYHRLPVGSDQAMIAALQKQTLSVAMDASSWHFQFYIGGIFSAKHCPDKPTLNHALEVVGYDVDHSGHKYWIVKNSWGILWGFGGYIKVDRDHVDTCGISQAASYPVVANTNSTSSIQ